MSDINIYNSLPPRYRPFGLYATHGDGVINSGFEAQNTLDQCLESTDPQMTCSDLEDVLAREGFIAPAPADLETVLTDSRHSQRARVLAVYAARRAQDVAIAATIDTIINRVLTSSDPRLVQAGLEILPMLYRTNSTHAERVYAGLLGLIRDTQTSPEVFSLALSLSLKLAQDHPEIATRSIIASLSLPADMSRRALQIFLLRAIAAPPANSLQRGIYQGFIRFHVPTSLCLEASVTNTLPLAVRRQAIIGLGGASSSDRGRVCRLIIDEILPHPNNQIAACGMNVLIQLSQSDPVLRQQTYSHFLALARTFHADFTQCPIPADRCRDYFTQLVSSDLARFRYELENILSSDQEDIGLQQDVAYTVSRHGTDSAAIELMVIAIENPRLSTYMLSDYYDNTSHVEDFINRLSSLGLQALRPVVDAVRRVSVNEQRYDGASRAYAQALYITLIFGSPDSPGQLQWLRPQLEPLEPLTITR
jgi:hypothetical protein